MNEFSKVFMAYVPKGVSTSWLTRTTRKAKSDKRRIFIKKGCKVSYDAQMGKVAIECVPIYTTLPTLRWV